jgi:hypothetical protein
MEKKRTHSRKTGKPFIGQPELTDASDLPELKGIDLDYLVVPLQPQALRVSSPKKKGETS